MTQAPVAVLEKRSEWGSMSLGLDRVRLCLERMGHPERLYGHTSVSGTNGKGTVSLNLAKGLGGRVGLFLSPHVYDVRERISLAGEWIEDSHWQAAYERIISVDPTAVDALSYFEWTLVLAVEIFARLNVEHAVFEVGLGGRDDAVNALSPERCILTNVSLDHQAILGATVADIAMHKVGIARHGKPFWLPRNVYELAGVKSYLESCAAVCHVLKPNSGFEGNFEMVDAILAAEGKRLTERFYLPGRRERIDWGAGLILDGAHNPAAWQDVLPWVLETFPEPPNVALSLSKGRLPEQAIALFKAAGVANIYRFVSGHERELESSAWPQIVDIRDVPRRQLETKPLFVTGSLYLLSAFRDWLGIANPRHTNFS